MNREISIAPAFDKRSDDPKKNYGIHGCELRFYLLGELGAVQFVVFTNWHLPHVLIQRSPDNDDHLFCKPTPADLGYHSYKPMYEGQIPMQDCHLLGGQCYYDGSSLQAQKVFDILLAEGSDGVWKHLEDYYHELFENNSDK